MMFLREILHVYTGSHFVVVVLVNNKKYTFNSTVNFEILSEMFEKFENINKSNFIAKYLKKMLIKPYNDGKVIHFPLPH